MKLARSFLATLSTFVAAFAREDRQAVLSTDAMLDAIAEVETGNNWRAVGLRGERGRCQFMETTWRQYTDVPFLIGAPHNSSLTWKVERAHLSHIFGYLAKQRIPFEPAMIAAAWRYGEGNATRFVRSDYARRVANLYWAKLAERGVRR